jgi:cell division protein YceG involved in septum cleavage
MKLYKIQEKEAGNLIEEDLTFEEAKQLLNNFNEMDKLEGIFVPDFYEIVEIED